VALLAVGALFASNMGFKLNYSLLAPGPGSATGTNTLSVPFNPQVGISNAQTLMTDIGSGSVFSISRYVESSNILDAYPGINFSLVPGEGVYVVMTSSVNYIVVGSHNPAQTVALNAPGVGSATGTNFISYPYHSTSGNAQTLMTEIGSTSVFSISRYVKSSNILDAYPGINFSLLPGEAYYVVMTSTVPGWVPAHY
jgi:hypothetical protein